ncbi:Seripauperin and TIP1 family-domain-containing protein [Scheffersomyces xylosifermentans]|uniref:Seripauperin and TIP1 family-domain-containing protein n=1 Tax=Scheffersomyces xylosifermentans TaxID=1304137 RepID=UPI00315C75C2
MKLTHFTSIFSLTFFVLSVVAQSVDSSEVEFLTRLVNDVRSHVTQYVQFIGTATVSVPQQFTSLARVIQTYTDDSYTTLLKDESIDFTQLEQFATDLPWYNRLAGTGTEGTADETAETHPPGSLTSATKTSTTHTGLATQVVVPVGLSVFGFVALVL